MRVLVVTNLYPPDSVGGYEQGCADVVEGLRQEGHGVRVLTRGVATPPPEDPPYVLRRLRFRHAGDRRLLLTGKAHDARDLAVVREVCEQFRPDVVYLWNLVGLGAPVATHLTDSYPTVLYVAGYWHRDWQAGLTRPDPLRHQALALVERPLLPGRLLNRAVQRAARWRFAPYLREVPPTPTVVEFDSRFLLEDAEQHGVHHPSSRVVPHAVDLSQFRPGVERAWPSRPLRLLFVGRVEPEKGIRTVLSALARLPSGGLPAQLSVIGPVSEAYQKELEELVSTLGVTEAVRWLGLVPHAELADIYVEHDIFVFASEFDEPFGIVLLEAMAAGLLIVSSCVGGAAEVAPAGVVAVAFTAGDPTSLAEAVWASVGTPGLRERCVARGRAVVQNYSRDAVTKMVVADLRDAIAQF